MSRSSRRKQRARKRLRDAQTASGAAPAASAAPTPRPGAFAAAIAEFEGASPWLGPQHEPAVVALRAMAAQLDKGDMTPALLGQYGLAFRALAKERPTAEQKDPLAAALEEAQAG